MWPLVPIVIGVLALIAYAVDASRAMLHVAFAGALILLVGLAALLFKLRRLDRAKSGAAPAAAQAGPAGMPRDAGTELPPPDEELGPLLATGLSLDADILYADQDGQTTPHRVIVRNIVGWRAEDLPQRLGVIVCWDPKHQEVLTFGINRIVQITDPATGVVAESPERWLEQRAGIAVPLAPWRAVRPEPLPPPCLLVWQSAPGQLEAFDVEVDTIETVDGQPVAISGNSRRRRTDEAPSWSGKRRFVLAPSSGNQERPVAIAWNSEDTPDRNVVDWVRRLIESSPVEVK